MVDKTNEKTSEEKKKDRKKDRNKALSHLGTIVLGILIGVLSMKNCEGEPPPQMTRIDQVGQVRTVEIKNLDQKFVKDKATLQTDTSSKTYESSIGFNLKFAPDFCPKPEPFSSLDCGDKSLGEKEKAAKAQLACKGCESDKGYKPILEQSKVVVAKADKCREEARARARSAAPTVARRSKAEQAARKDAVVQAAIDACKTQGGRWGCCRAEVFKAFKAHKNLNAPGITDMDQLVKEVVSGNVSLPVTMADTDWYNSRVQGCMGG